MKYTHMTTDQIMAVLESVGMTGQAEIRQTDGLYIQREENSDWRFWGIVVDANEARTLITEFFDH